MRTLGAVAYTDIVDDTAQNGKYVDVTDDNDGVDSSVPFFSRAFPTTPQRWKGWLATGRVQRT